MGCNYGSIFERILGIFFNIVVDVEDIDVVRFLLVKIEFKNLIRRGF